ncbi:glutathione S-transferase, partial [Paraphaeosphaeria minitans]
DLASRLGDQHEDAVPRRVGGLLPKVYGWVSRFKHALEEAAASGAGPVGMNGDEAISCMKTVKENVEGGTLVEMYRSDRGSECRDAGRLVALARDEVTIMAEGALGLHMQSTCTAHRLQDGRLAAKL